MKNAKRSEIETDSHVGLPAYAGMLSEICQKNNINLRWFSNNWVAMLEKNEKIRYIMGYKFGINSAATSMIADDKSATYEILKTHEIPAVEHQLLYDEHNSEAYAKKYQSKEYVERFFTENNHHIVMKPNNGQGGINIYQVSTLNEIESAREKVLRKSQLASMCPFYEITSEYRFVMLDNEVRLAYKKVRGDDWRFNLNQGAHAEKIKNGALYAQLENIAKSAVRVLGLRFCSVDIVETEERKLLVMEVNSGVVIEKYLQQYPEEFEKVKRIYRDAVLKMFAEN